MEVKSGPRNCLYVIRKRVKDYNFLLLFSCVWGFSLFIFMYR